MKIAVTGTPGTGKTKVASLLAKKLEYNIIHLNSEIKKHKLYSGFDKKRKTYVVDEVRLKKHFRVIKDNTIVEGHLSHLLPVDVIILLRTNPVILRKRLKKKGWKKNKVVENVMSEVLDIIKVECINSGKPIIEVISSGSVKKTVDEILSLLEKKKQRILDIKWLGLYFIKSTI